MELIAPAKLNLRLEVLAKLPNGYHQLRMFNITVSLYDEIQLELTQQGLQIEIDQPGIPVDESNTVYRAVRYFQAKFGIKFGLRVKIHKQIPQGAGLAGGSSDSATVLRALLQEFRLKISDLSFEELAYQVGADVPYLLFGGPAWVEGIGEKIEKVSNFPSLVYLLVKPGFSCSTKEVFQAFTLADNLTIEPKEVIFSAVSRKDWEIFCVNHLEKVVLERNPIMRKLKQEIVRQGALASVMSGSGSTLVGIFSNEAQAQIAGEEILKFQPEFWVKVVKQIQPRWLEMKEV